MYTFYLANTSLALLLQMPVINLNLIMKVIKSDDDVINDPTPEGSFV